MHPYIPHLLCDIRKAHQEQDPKQADLSFLEKMEAIENWAERREIPDTLSNKCELYPDQFPPPDQLSEADMRLVIQAMEEMLKSWHRKVFIPEEVPDSMAYTLIIHLLEEEAWDIPDGYLCYDFCTGYAPECELKEYCPCLKVWNQPEI